MSVFNKIKRFINPRSNEYHSLSQETHNVLFSANTINRNIIDLEMMELEIMNRVYKHEKYKSSKKSEDIYPYSDSCNNIFNFLELLEKYYLFISTDISMIDHYYKIRHYILNFINFCDKAIISYTNRYFICHCDSIYSVDGIYNFDAPNVSYLLYDEFCYLNKICELGEIKNMENYDGYINRREYRLYKKNFIMNSSMNIFGSNSNYACHDYKQIRDELNHWLKYFNKLHRYEMANYKTILSKYTILNNNCIENIIDFM